MAYTKEILPLAVEIGDCMLRNGAEIYRVEDTVVHILSSYEVEEFDVYVLSNGIFASANENKEDACSIVRHVFFHSSSDIHRLQSRLPVHLRPDYHDIAQLCYQIVINHLASLLAP